MFNINACADKWLQEEIGKFNPHKIIAFGKYPGLYLWGKPIDKFEKIVGRLDLKYKHDTNINLLIIYHPSGNSRAFNKWRENNHKLLFDTIRKFLM